jgi:hypothetical protein
VRRRPFTVAEANALLPHLEGVLATIQMRMESVRGHAERLQILDVLWGERLLAPENPDHPEALAARLSIAALMGDVEQLVEREIRARGLRFPPGGLEHGLIDFPTTLNGRWVLLCWRRGEPGVENWHEISAGFAGRRPVTPYEERTMGADDGVGDPPPFLA